MLILAIILSVVFAGLGLLHFSWALGGTFGFENSLPTNSSGERVLNPGKIDCAIVGIGLTVFGLFYLVKTGLIGLDLPIWILTPGGWTIPAIFLLRAVGEFKYVGFFKRIRTTDFGKLDTRFLSPLCLVIGILGILIQVAN